MGSLFQELRRRNVFRVAGVYAVTGWLIIQVIVAVKVPLGLPVWTDTFFIVLVLAGFPVALLFAWAFEMTPEGMKRTQAVAPSESIAAKTGRKLDYAILIGLVLVAVIVIADRVMPHRADGAAQAAVAAAEIPDAAPASAAPASAPGDKSIAVLPFVDLSPSGDQEYFADGLSEELLNVLAKTRALKVAGRTSSFAFKGDNRDLREIGELLDVAYILEGSVRKAGEKIRVTAQLIKASDGYHVFSDTYDGDLNDIFAVQDAIAAKIGGALRAELMGGANAAETAAPSDLAAYDLYLLARQRIYTREADKMNEAAQMLDRAIELDPEFAPAYAQRAIVASLLSGSSSSYGDMPVDEADRIAKKFAEKAIALDPSLAEAHAALGLQRYGGGGTFEERAAPLQRALELNPTLSDARNWLGILYLDAGRIDEALAAYEAIFERDPLYGPAFANLVGGYATRGQMDKVAALTERVARIGGETPVVLLARGMIAKASGDLSLAIEYFRQSSENSNSNVLRYQYSSTLLQVGELEEALNISIPSDKPEILYVMGRKEEALAAVAALPKLDYGDRAILYSTFAVNARAGRYKESADYLSDNFGDLASVAADSPTSASDWLGSLTYSYKKLGRKTEFAEALAMLEEAYAVQVKNGSDSWWHWLLAAELALLKDDDAGALAHLRTVQEKGGLWAPTFWPVTFADLRGNEELQAIQAEMMTRINAERADLGLAPLSPSQ